MGKERPISEPCDCPARIFIVLWQSSMFARRAQEQEAYLVRRKGHLTTPMKQQIVSLIRRPVRHANRGCNAQALLDRLNLPSCRTEFSNPFFSHTSNFRLPSPRLFVQTVSFPPLLVHTLSTTRTETLYRMPAGTKRVGP